MVRKKEKIERGREGVARSREKEIEKGNDR